MAAEASAWNILRPRISMREPVGAENSGNREGQDRLVVCRQRASVYLDGPSVCKKAKQVDKMAHLTKNSASALLGIVDPVIGRQRSGIDAVVHRQRLMDVFHE